MENPTNPSALDLMAFHGLERGLYKRLVRNMGLEPESMKWVMALWLWLETIGHHDFIRHLAAYVDRHIVIGFVEEATAALNRLAGHVDRRLGSEDIPFTNSLVLEPMTLRFFDYHREKAIAGVARIYHNVCRIIFDDGVMQEVARDRSHPASARVLSSGLIMRPFRDEDSSSSSSSSSAVSCSSERLLAKQLSKVVVSMPPILPSPSQPSLQPTQMALLQSSLNPSAEPWSPVTNPSSEDQRSMFITFSRGYPLSREDISEFFTRRYGPSVEVVMIERAPPGTPPMDGRVVFKSVSMIAVVLNGQRTAKFMINGRHLWARMYVPRHGSATTSLS